MLCCLNHTIFLVHSNCCTMFLRISNFVGLWSELSNFWGCITTYLSKRIFFPFSDKLQLLVLRRLSRIKLIEVPRRTKIKAVRMMVISLFSWSGAWQSLTKKVLGQWRIAIEKAIMSPVRHRFRFLLWAASLGPYVDPEFCLNFEALRHQQWKCSSRAPRAIDRTSVSSRLNQVLASWD